MAANLGTISTPQDATMASINSNTTLVAPGGVAWTMELLQMNHGLTASGASARPSASTTRGLALRAIDCLTRPSRTLGEL